LRDLKIAEADDANSVTAAQGLLDILEGGIDGLLGRVLRQVGFFRHVGDQLSFVHGIILSLGAKQRRYDLEAAWVRSDSQTSGV
jgi:hypothetical protein